REGGSRAGRPLGVTKVHMEQLPFRRQVFGRDNGNLDFFSIRGQGESGLYNDHFSRARSTWLDGNLQAAHDPAAVEFAIEAAQSFAEISLLLLEVLRTQDLAVEIAHSLDRPR